MREANPIPTRPGAFIVFVTRPYYKTAAFAVLVVVLAAAASQASSYFFKLIIDASEAGEVSLVFLYALLYPTALFVVQLLYRLSGVLGM